MAALEHDYWTISKILPSCDLSVGPGVRGDECTVCRGRIEANQPTITHQACENTWCTACIRDWVVQLDNDSQRPRCPMCQANISVFEEDYNDLLFAAQRLQARLNRPAAQDVRVFQSRSNLILEAWSHNDNLEYMQLEAAINSESLEVEALSRRHLLSLKSTHEIWERLRPQQIPDAMNTLIGEISGARTYRQYRIDHLPGVECCLPEMPPLMIAASAKEVQSVLGEATFNRILSKTASRGLGRLIEWPSKFLDLMLIDQPWSMDFAYFQYLQSRIDTTWMILSCDVNETPFHPLDAKRSLSRRLAFVFPSVRLAVMEVESTPQHADLVHNLRKDVTERCKNLPDHRILPRKRQYNSRPLTTLETLLVTNEVGTRLWEQLVAPLLRDIPTKPEQAQPVPNESHLNDQLLELSNLLQRFHIAWRLYYRNYWHHILEGNIERCPLRRASTGQSSSCRVTQTLQKLLIDGTILGKPPVHKCVKRAAMDGVAAIITKEAIKLAQYHVGFGWKPTIEDRKELEGDHVHDLLL